MSLETMCFMNFNCFSPQYQLLLKSISFQCLIAEISIVDLRSQHSIAFPLLNQCQRNVYEYVVAVVMESKQALVFVHWHGGTRKTFLWHTAISKIRSKDLIVIAVASSGITSLLLLGDRTVQSRFKIPLTIFETSSCEIYKNTNLSHVLEMTSFIVWDEAPVNNRCCFEVLDLSLHDVLTFNGLYIQILPVVPEGKK